MAGRVLGRGADLGGYRAGPPAARFGGDGRAVHAGRQAGGDDGDGRGFPGTVAADEHRRDGLGHPGYPGERGRVRLPQGGQGRVAGRVPQGPGGHGQRVRVHAAVLAAIGPFALKAGGERALARRLYPELEEDWLLIADRGFYDWPDWCTAADTGAALLWRFKSDIRLPVLEILPDGSYRSVLVTPKAKAAVRQELAGAARAGEELDPARARHVRVVEYEVPDRDGQDELIALVTTITDPLEAPAAVLAAAYHQRWEHEICHCWYRSGCAAFSWLRSFVAAGFCFRGCPAGARADPARPRPANPAGQHRLLHRPAARRQPRHHLQVRA
jgi:hypothetical protein